MKKEKGLYCPCHCNTSDGSMLASSPTARTPTTLLPGRSGFFTLTLTTLGVKQVLFFIILLFFLGPSVQQTSNVSNLRNRHLFYSRTATTTRKQSSSTRELVLPPKEWICSPKNYNSSDGCHCLCGAHDPDCDTTLNNELALAINCPCPEQQLLLLFLDFNKKLSVQLYNFAQPHISHSFFFFYIGVH